MRVAFLLLLSLASSGCACGHIDYAGAITDSIWGTFVDPRPDVDTSTSRGYRKMWEWENRNIDD